VVVEGLGLFGRFGDIVELDGDFEFTPTGLVDLEGLAFFAFDHCGVLVAGWGLGGGIGWKKETYSARGWG